MKEPEYLEKSLRVLEKLCPTYVEAIKDADTSYLEFCKTTEGELNIRNRGGENDFYFHSQQGALAEAQKWFDQLPFLQATETLLVFGIGLGYSFYPAKEWLGQSENRFLVFLEDDFSLLKQFCSTKHASEILSHPRVVIIPFQASSKLEKTPSFREGLFNENEVIFEDSDFEGMFLTFVNTFLRFSSSGSYLMSRRKLCERLYVYIDLKIKDCIRKQEFYKGRYQASFFRNFYANVNYLPDSYDSCSLQGRFKGIPAIICGAGPSLETQLTAMSKLRDKALIFGAGTGMNALNKNNITAHFGSGVDPNPDSASRMMTNYAYEVPYFYQNEFYPKAFLLMHGPKLNFIGKDFFGVQTWLYQELGLGDFPSILSEVSTTCSCLGLADFLGCNPIVFVGVDLAYTGEKRYPGDVQAHPLATNKERESISKLPADKFVPLETGDDQDLYTTVDWLKEASLYSEFAKKHPETLLINTNEKGWRIQNLLFKNLQDVSEQTLTQSLDLLNWVHAEIQGCQLVDVSEQSLQKALAKWRESLVKTVGYFDEIIDALVDGKRQNTLQNKVEGEIAYKAYLGEMEEAFIERNLRDLHVLKYHPEALSEAERNRKESLFELKKTAYLRKVAANQIELLDLGVEEYRTRKALLEKRSKAPVENVKSSMGEGYSFENDRFIIDDPELDISYNEPFSPPLVDANSPSAVMRFASIQNGKPDGQCHLYYPKGALKGEMYYSNGKIHGPSTFFSESGKVLARGWFVEDLREGKNWQYYLSGQVYSLQRYRKGLAHGLQEYFYESGVLKTTMLYQESLLDGPARLYHPNGQLKREMNFRDGKLHGKERMWNEEGKCLLEVEYEGNQPVRFARSWYPNGILRKEVVYYDTPEHFDTLCWDEEGDLVEKKLFTPGKKLLTPEEVRQSVDELTKELAASISQLGKLSVHSKGEQFSGLDESLAELTEELKDLKRKQTDISIDEDRSP